MGGGQSKETIITNLKSQIAVLEKDKNFLGSEKKGLEERNAKLKHEIIIHTEEKNHLTEEINKLEAEVKIIETSVEKEKHVVEDPREKELRHVLANKENEFKGLKNECAHHKAEKVKLEAEIAALNEKHQEILVDIDKSSEEISGLDQKISELKEQEETLAEESAKLAELVNELNSSEKTAEQVRIEAAANKIHQEKAAHRAALTEADIRLLQEEQELDERLKLLHELTGKVGLTDTELQGIIAKLEATKLSESENSHLSGLIARNSELTQKVSDLTEASEKYEKFTNDINKYTNRKAKQEQKLKDMDAEIVNLTDSVAVFKGFCEPNELDAMDYDELKEQVKKIKKKVESKLKKIEKHEEAVNKKFRKHGGLLG